MKISDLEVINNVRVDIALSGMSYAQLFLHQYREVFRHEPMGNTIDIDAQRWARAEQYHQRPVPSYYTTRFYERLEEDKERFKRASRWQGAYHRTDPMAKLTLVDSDSPVLHAHRCKDGIWRT